jgi:hypothetical protein
MIIDRAAPTTTGDRHKRSSHPTTWTDNSRPMSDWTENEADMITICVQPTTNQRNSTEPNYPTAQNSRLSG